MEAVMSVPFEEMSRVYNAQQEARWRVARTSAVERIEKLEKLRDALWAHRAQMQEALQADFRKHPGETDLTEFLPMIGEINHTIRHLSGWMRPRKVKTPKILLGTRSEVRYEAKGQVLVLSPWNYPVNLLIGPLVAAIAAGNVVILKPSSKVPETAAFLKHLFDELYPEDEVFLFAGGTDVSKALLELRFDHIFFTGSTEVGRKVMTAAAANLTPVTLELGGKSPVIVDASADIRKTAERVLWGKFVNGGQTCVAPDYMLIHESRRQEFIDHSCRIIEERFGRNQSTRKANPSFCRLVSRGHIEGLLDLLERSESSGAQVEFGGGADLETHFLEPTIVTGVDIDSPLMKEEIFGPILPVITFSRLSEAVEMVQAGEKPLALYVFSEDEGNTEYVLSNTTSGGSCVNTVMLHLANPDLPFGGVGASGMGSYHGFHGFETLSHKRAVLHQGRLDTLKMFYPPYTDKVRGLISKAARFLS
jgi:aldehyde dehydrogenase (NAD+)